MHTKGHCLHAHTQKAIANISELMCKLRVSIEAAQSNRTRGTATVAQFCFLAVAFVGGRYSRQLVLCLA